MSRANSLKKAVRQIIEHTERVLDEQTQDAMTQQAVAMRAPPQILLHASDAAEGMEGIEVTFLNN